ncbi:MAG TPA: hypothetical protein GXZ90_08475 [Clostridiales bacterium]|nr:hypothetical protein [Clostridiales bacterium]
MLNYTLSKDNIEKLNYLIQDKNNISILNRFESSELEEKDYKYFEEIGIINKYKLIEKSVDHVIDTLANPYNTVNIMFTGGVSTYEQSINYNDKMDSPVMLTMTPDNIYIKDDDVLGVVDTLQDFVGNSSLKSINYSKKYNENEAYVIAVFLDMERKATLRSFIDEMPFSSNSYNVNMLWRVLNSTGSSIQWYVHILKKIIGEHKVLTQTQVKEALDSLVKKGDIVQVGSLYQPSAELTSLASRMIIVDNVLLVQSVVKKDVDEVISSGFTCVQTGVHDLLFIDFNGEEVILETISSSKLLNYITSFIK